MVGALHGWVFSPKSCALSLYRLQKTGHVYGYYESDIALHKLIFYATTRLVMHSIAYVKNLTFRCVYGIL